MLIDIITTSLQYIIGIGKPIGINPFNLTKPIYYISEYENGNACLEAH